MATSQTSAERITRYRNRQLAAGRKLITSYIAPDTLAKLKRLSGRKPLGETIDRAVTDLYAKEGQAAGSESGQQQA